MERHLHIVSLNVPYPPDYGGLIEIWYKLKALADEGIHIHLHCFDYGRGIQPEMNTYCKSVTYYSRKTGIKNGVGKYPYIVASRSNIELLENLTKDTHPILFEGLHTTYFLSNPKLSTRVKVVRTHNIEHEYYRLLASKERNIFRRIYYNKESKRLSNYVSQLGLADAVAAISINDTSYFSNVNQNTFWLPPFHPNSEVISKTGSGSYMLYHGNLSVHENIEAALFLIDAFKTSDLKLRIAGKDPDKNLYKEIENTNTVSLIANPSFEKMDELISNAHINLLPTFQPTGIKLKLITSLYEGRHCLVNSSMIEGTELGHLCHLANTKKEFVQKARLLMELPFEDKDLFYRKEILLKKFNNSINAKLLISKIF